MIALIAYIVLRFAIAVVFTCEFVALEPSCLEMASVYDYLYVERVLAEATSLCPNSRLGVCVLCRDLCRVPVLTAEFFISGTPSRRPRDLCEYMCRVKLHA